MNIHEVDAIEAANGQAGGPDGACPPYSRVYTDELSDTEREHVAGCARCDFTWRVAKHRPAQTETAGAGSARNDEIAAARRDARDRRRAERMLTDARFTLGTIFAEFRGAGSTKRAIYLHAIAEHGLGDREPSQRLLDELDRTIAAGETPDAERAAARAALAKVRPGAPTEKQAPLVAAAASAEVALPDVDAALAHTLAMGHLDSGLRQLLRGVLAENEKSEQYLAHWQDVKAVADHWADRDEPEWMAAYLREGSLAALLEERLPEVKSKETEAHAALVKLAAAGEFGDGLTRGGSIANAWKELYAWLEGLQSQCSSASKNEGA